MAEKMILGSDRLRDLLNRFPELCRQGWKLGEGIRVDGEIDNIFVLGMGGSARGGEILKSFLKDSKIPLFIVRDYSIPRHLSKNSFVFSVSYSGDTEEAISSYKMAVKRTNKIICLASGGKFFELAKANKTTLIKLPPGMPARFSYGSQFFAMLRVLINSDLIAVTDSDVEHALRQLKPDKFSAIGKEIAEKLFDKIPLIYTSERLRAVGYTWAIDFNESTKIHAFHNVFPEVPHNELQAFTKLNGNYGVIMIKDEEDFALTKKRMDIARGIIKRYGVEASELVVKGDNLLTKLISAICIGNWTAYHLAVKYGIDPWTQPMVDEFKELMKK